MNTNQEELKQTITDFQKISVKKLDLCKELVDDVLSGEFDNNLLIIESTLHLTLLASHTPKGRDLFLQTLDYVKTIFPETAAEFWEAYDDFENIYKTDFYSLPQ